MIITPNLLIVSHDDINRRDIRKILEKHNFNVSEATNGVEALNRIMSGEPCDAITAQVNSASKIGKELFDQVRSFRPGIPIIIISNKKRLTALVECREIGGDDYSTLPLNEKN